MEVYYSHFLFTMLTEVMKMREEEKKQSSRWKKFLKKRWVYPAVYLVGAALLISGIIWFQQLNKSILDPQQPNTPDNTDVQRPDDDDDAIEVTQNFEEVIYPFDNVDDIEVVTYFFDIHASAEEQEAALIANGNKYHPNMGIDYAHKDGAEFEVLAALSGKVTAVRKDSLLGNVIEIDHGSGVTTVYQSIKDIKVQVGDTVKQGDVIATSGTSQLNKAAKNHLHFELRKDSVALNPLEYFGQLFSTIGLEPYDVADSSEENKEDADKEEDSRKEESESSDTDATENEEARESKDSENEESTTPPENDEE